MSMLSVRNPEEFYQDGRDSGSSDHQALSLRLLPRDLPRLKDTHTQLCALFRVPVEGTESPEVAPGEAL